MQRKRSYHSCNDDDNLAVSLERAYAEIHRHHFKGRAAASTVEALMLGLRQRGTAALKKGPAQSRLGQLSEPQLHEVCARLQKLNPDIARAWTADEVVVLVERWAACHGR